MPFFIDMNYVLIVMIPSLIISGLAQMWVRSAFRKWSETRNGAGMSGVEVGERIRRAAGLNAVSFESVAGTMTDHFDPQGNIVRMSQDVATRPSVASMAIVAHELGHAQQYQESSPLIAMRSFLVPAMRFSPMVSYALILMGVLFNATGLITLGGLFFAVVVLFMLLTLPVEFDASRRGLKLLEQANLLTAPQDGQGSRQMLTAAAMTYVAAFVSSLLTLLYYISILQNRN